MNMNDILTAIAPVTERYDVPLSIVATIIQVESGWNPRALGDKGTSYGLFQLHTPGGQGDVAIQDGHKPEDLFDPLLNARYGMPAIARAWDQLKASFDASNHTWWLDFAALSGHPGGSPTDPATITLATIMQRIYPRFAGLSPAKTPEEPQAAHELANFPVKNQRIEPDTNRDFDCVPESLAAALQWLTGKIHTATELKDAVYGPGYQGGTAAAAYVQYVEQFGVKLWPFNGENAALVQEAHRQIALQHPVIFTERDPYAPGHPDWSHVCVWFAAGPGWLRAMDPFGGQVITRPDSEWANDWLRFNQIWIMEKKVSSNIPQGWSDDGSTLKAPNGQSVVKGFRQYILNNARWQAENLPLEAEEPDPAVASGTRQLFVYDELGWTPEKGVYRKNIGQELLALRQQVAQPQTLSAGVRTALQQAEQAIAAILEG